jgi:SEC-C motif-containing protein
MAKTELCPCGSNKTYDECCGAVILGKRDATTAEELMRSRYTAYVKHEIDYIVATCDNSDKKTQIDYNQTKKWAEESQWLGLEIVRTEAGTENDKRGVVDFIATFRNSKGVKEEHHEIAEFEKINGKWLYIKGRFAPVQQVVRSTAKVGRNEPCPCGSGKKYKHCCGA